MKLIWKLSIPQALAVICLGLTSFIIVNSSFIKMRDRYVRDVVEHRVSSVLKGIETNAQESVKQTSVFVNMPAVMQAYEIALSGDIYDVNSPQSQQARELLRRELAPILDSYNNATGYKLQLHFHLPSGFSLARLWRDKNTMVDGKWVDISDDLRLQRHTVLEVNRSGKTTVGLEPGNAGFAIRGVIPVKAPDGRLLGSAEVIRDFEPVLAAITVEGKFDVALYANKEVLDFSVELQDSKKYPPKGDFVRVINTQDKAIESRITPKLLSDGKNGSTFENLGPITFAAFPLYDYSGKQSGVLACAMNTRDIYAFAYTAGAILALMLAGMVMASSIVLMLGLHMLVTSPLNKVKDKIQDITEDRADLTELVPDLQKDEIGELARWFNKLTAKVGGLLDGLREADERAQNLLDATPLCASLWDKDAIIFCNQVAATLFDLSGKQEFKDRFFELLPERQPCGGLSRELLFEYKTKALEEGECSFEWVHQKLNGDPIPCEVKFVRIKHRGKHILASYILDLRERYEMLNALREESTKFEAAAHWHESILDSIPFPISVQDKEAKWIFINATLERLLGKNRKDIVGLPCSDWGVSICNTDDCAIACAKRGEKQTYFKQDGVSYQVDIEILKDLKGETTGYIEVIQDITRLEQAAKQHAEAEAASIAKSAFLAKMSHEIRTPINAVLGITEMQLQDTSHSLSTRDAFGKIYTAGYTLLGIINEILDLSKIESGKMELIPAKYEIVSLISDTVQLNMARIGSKPIEFKLYIDENIPLKLFGDELRIKQILNNLLSNAFKYTQEGKVELSVSVEHESKETDSDVTIVFHVNDTGQGMTESQVQVLFHEYSRFDMVANRMIEGTGLGMNITQHLVSMMNGEIFVESEPGEGTLFTVRLPQGRIGTGVVGKDLAQSLQLFKKTAMSHTKAAQLVREPMPYGNVLIVDDLEMNLYVGKGLMAPYGLSIDTALSGFEAIEKIRSGNEYDIVFMDHMMPKMDGIEATKTLRDLMGYTRPIVALTASAVVGQEEMFLENGFDDFISKPVDLYRMDMVLNKFIRDKQPPEVIDAARRQQNKNSENVADDKMPNITADPQLAKIFARDAERALITLEAVVTNRFRRDNDLQIFVINIHAMKSALINIGEPALANNAYKLEQAGKSGNISVMLSETAAFLTDLQAVIKKVKPKQEG